MQGQHIIAIIQKQCKDTLKNKAILIQFVMFPVMSIILSNSVSSFDLMPAYFTIMFATMYISMAPLLILSSAMSEEKEKGSLRMMIMSNVKPMEYLIGMGTYVFILCMIGICIMGLWGGIDLEHFSSFLLINASGLLVSIVLGALIGMISRNQSMAAGLSTPVMLLTSFLPMLSMFNEQIKSIGQFLYSMQINELLTELSTSVCEPQRFWIILLNSLIVTVLYSVLYRRGRYFQ